MKKRIFKLSIFMILMVLILTGCKVQTVDEYNRTEDDQQLVESNDDKDPDELKSSAKKNKDEKDEEKDDEKTEEDDNKDKKEDEKTEEDDNKDKKEDTSGKETNKEDKDSSNKSKVKDNTNKNSSNKSKDKSNKKSNPKTEAKPETKPDPKPASKPDPKPTAKPDPKPTTKYVTIQIRVDAALKNYDKLDPKLQNEKFVPSNGSVLGASKYELKDGETAFDILVKATRENRIHMDYTGSGGSSYIKGINQLYEFNCGDSSGWMYTVNGSRPSLSVGAYKLKDGDSIRFDYTCDLGNDL